ncbi:tolloid-like protein 2 [Physella acuta]|uniref:tolloid-like protein 2 n=1 Tax=Physella acuta TaxID=109671 RepID=UPI0027DBB90D|nr:tolloid-like protein 2 [Physella acuta]
MSPNFPESYPDNAYCAWAITVESYQIIDFRFKRLDIERRDEQYCIDYLKLYDGPDSNSTLIGTYCGYQNDADALNVIVRTTGYQLYVQFVSDESGSRPGFSASYGALECPPFYYGRDKCESPCVCVQENTQYCDNKKGACYCQSGWFGYDCSIDTNECEDPNICEDVYSVCNNTKAGYDCLCKPGLQKNSTGACKAAVNECTTKKCSHYCGVTSKDPWTEVCSCPKGMRLNATDQQTCIECDNTTYGDNCALGCNCYYDHTKSCNKENGLCTCKLEWTSSNCYEDVDECSLEKPPCTKEHDNAFCYNTWGSFECRCVRNFEVFNETYCNECGKTFTETSGKIDSGVYSGGYLGVETQLCNWTIIAPLGQVITLNLQFKYQIEILL